MGHQADDLNQLKKRAFLLREIRAFMDARDVLEVETPMLSLSAPSDPAIESFRVVAPKEDEYQQSYYLHTSPEYYMKRLLSAGSPSIFQITKAFRCEEEGRYHRPEFTMLEWYRLGFDLDDLMGEISALLQDIGLGASSRISYRELFHARLGIDPHTVSANDLLQCMSAQDLSFESSLPMTRDELLECIFSHCLAPKLGQEEPVFIYDYPLSMAALAKTEEDKEGIQVARRCELFIAGVEIANGFFELTDAVEQRRRFGEELHRRKIRQQPLYPLDELFLAALSAGLPDCSGVALGLDRLLMVQCGANCLSSVMAFDELTGRGVGHLE